MKPILAGALMLLLSPVGPDAIAQGSDDLDDLTALRYYADVLSSMESLAEVSRMTRDNIRASDWAQHASGAKGSGVLLRGVYKAISALAEQSTLPKGGWPDRWEKAHNARNGIRGVAAAIHGLKEFYAAIQNAETSTAEEKLNSLAQILKDVSATIPSKTPVSAYVGLLADAIESIAGDAAIIEAHTRKKDEIIEAIGRNFGEDYSEPSRAREAAPLASAVDELERRIADLERKAAQEADEEAYRRVRGAEDECAAKHKLSMEEIATLRSNLAKDRRRLRQLSQEQQAIVSQDQALRELIDDSKNNLAIARAESRGGEDSGRSMRAIERIPSLEQQLEIYRRARRVLRGTAPKRSAELRDEYDRVRGRASLAYAKLGKFNACVRANLADDEVRSTDLMEYFPDYARKRVLHHSRPDPSSPAHWRGIWDTSTNAPDGSRLHGPFIFGQEGGKTNFVPQPNSPLQRLGYSFVATSMRGGVLKGEWSNPGYKGTYEITFQSDPYNKGFVTFTGKYSRVLKTGLTEEWFEWKGWDRGRSLAPSSDK